MPAARKVQRERQKWRRKKWHEKKRHIRKGQDKDMTILQTSRPADQSSILANEE